MKRGIIVVVVVAALAGGTYYFIRGNGAQANTQTAQGRGPQGGFGGFGGPRLPMTVELAPVTRGTMAESLTVVGSLIGEATVEAVPRVSGRLEGVFVRLGDRVSRGQRLAKIEDSELLEQIKQADASFEVSAATIRQREADLRLAQTNLDRSKNLHDRDLIPRQIYDDTDARHQASVAQLDLAKAQFTQAQARLDELKITLANTVITSPVSGFVGKRALDPGAWVTPNSSFISLVDISTVRLVANVIEKDLRRVSQGLKANVTVDAFPGEEFSGHIARIAPILEPATRTAQIEVEIPNPSFRLKPGMYATVSFMVEQRERTLIVPANAVVDHSGQKGVFLPTEGDIAKFHAIKTGMVQPNQVEVLEGLEEGTRVITTGAGALRDNDRIVLLGSGEGGPGRGGNGPGRGSAAERGGERGRAPGSRGGAAQ